MTAARPTPVLAVATAPSPDDERQAEAFLIAFARAAHTAGTPAHRLEETIAELAQRLGRRTVTMSSPTMLLLGFGPAEQQRTVLLRVEPAEIHLARLDDLYYVARRVRSGAWSADDGLRAIQRIELAPATPSESPLTTVLLWLLLSATLARFFGGGLLEIAAGSVIGALIGFLQIAWPRVTTGAPVLELLASAVAAFVASGAAHLAAAHGERLSAYVSMLAGVVGLLPGFMLTVAVTELASRHLASGTARATAAAATLLQMAVGVALGSKLGESLFGPTPNAAPVALPEWTELALVPVATVVMALFSYARRERLFAIVVVCALGYFGARWGGDALGPELGAAVGAFVVGLASRAHAELAECPQLVTLVPATLMLVPGSFGFRSVSLFLGQDVTSGIDAAMRMLLIAMAIAAGLLMAQAIGHRRSAL